MMGMAGGGQPRTMSKPDDGITIPGISRYGGPVEHSFWTLLAYQHDGLAGEIEAARLAHRRHQMVLVGQGRTQYQRSPGPNSIVIFR